MAESKPIPTSTVSKSDQPPLQPGESTYNRTVSAPGVFRFDVIPANVGGGGAAFHHFFLAICVFMLSLAATQNPVVGVFSAVIAFVIMRVFRKAAVTQERAAGGGIVVDAVGLAWDKYQVEKHNISGFIIKPAYEHKVDQSKARTWKVNRLQESSWQLIMEYSGRSALLAGGMTEHTARGLMRDVMQTLGMK